MKTHRMLERSSKETLCGLDGYIVEVKISGKPALEIIRQNKRKRTMLSVVCDGDIRNFDCSTCQHVWRRITSA